MDKQIGDLVADLGGTNIRLAMVTEQRLSHLSCYKCADFESLEAVIRCYTETHQLQVTNACIGIAGPVSGDSVKMTNLGWEISISELQASLGLAHLSFINDYTAIAMSLPELDQAQLHTLSGGSVEPDAPRVVCGPGTGLGLAQLVRVNGQYGCISGEGGHVEFAPNNRRQLALLGVLMDRFAHVSIERLLSGSGLENIYQGLALLEQRDVAPLQASEITRAYIEKECPLCVETVELFLQVLAQFLGNLALTSGAYGGVYIAGGIMPRLVDHLSTEQFMADFLNKGRFADYLSPMPVFLITEDQPGLIGAAAYLKQALARPV